MIWYDVIWYDMIWFDMMLDDMIWYGMIWCVVIDMCVESLWKYDLLVSSLLSSVLPLRDVRSLWIAFSSPLHYPLLIFLCILPIFALVPHLLPFPPTFSLLFPSFWLQLLCTQRHVRGPIEQHMRFLLWGEQHEQTAAGLVLTTDHRELYHRHSYHCNWPTSFHRVPQLPDILSLQVYGDADNLLRPTSAVYNIGLDKLHNAMIHFSQFSSLHSGILGDCK